MSKGRGPRRDEAKERFWWKLIGEFDPSRTTVRQWCIQHGVSEPSFYAWRRVLNRRKQESASASRPAQRVRLLPVVVAPPTASTIQPPSSKLTIRLACGLQLRVSIEQLPVVLDVLESRSC